MIIFTKDWRTVKVRFFITFHCIFYIEESIVHNLLLPHEKLFVSNRKSRKRMKLSDDSTCISYREVIKGMTKAFLCQRVKREAKSWSFCQTWSILVSQSSDLSYRITASHTPASQDFSPSKVTHERFSSIFRSVAYLLKPYRQPRGFTTAEYVSNCSNWSWVLLFRKPFEIRM